MENVYNWGDVTMAESTALHKRGTVFLYKNPSEIIPNQLPPTMKTSLDVFNSFKPLFEALAKKFPDVSNQSELQYIVLQLYAYFIQQKKYVVLVHNVIWTLLGLYGVITLVDGDEEITWHNQNNKSILHVVLDV